MFCLPVYSLCAGESGDNVKGLNESQALTSRRGLLMQKACGSCVGLFKIQRKFHTKAIASLLRITKCISDFKFGALLFFKLIFVVTIFTLPRKGYISTPFNKKLKPNYFLGSM